MAIEENALCVFWTTKWHFSNSVAILGAILSKASISLTWIGSYRAWLGWSNAKTKNQNCKRVFVQGEISFPTRSNKYKNNQLKLQGQWPNMKQRNLNFSHFLPVGELYNYSFITFIQILSISFMHLNVQWTSCYLMSMSGSGYLWCLQKWFRCSGRCNVGLT